MKLSNISNNQIAFLAILFMIVSLVCNSVIYQKAGEIVTGKSTATAELSICINHPPVLTIDCDDAGVGSPYLCDIDASDYDNTITSGIQTLIFSDNSTLFNISSSTGLIQFTPTSAQKGNYTITITATDNSTCSNSMDSGLLNLTVTEFYCGDGSCNGYETCSSCPADCGACAEAPAAAAAGGGGGGGGGPGESSKGCHVNLCKVDSKILRTKEKEIVWGCFGFVGYELKITEVNENGFTLFINGIKETATISLNEKKEFDMDKDGLPDMVVQLVKIQGKDVWIFFEPMEGINVVCKKTEKDALVAEPGIIRISIKLGDTVEKSISVSNIGSDTLDVNVEERGLDNIVRFKGDGFSLEAFQKKIFNVIFDASEENIKAGVYNGKIIFSTEGIRKEVLVIVEVETKKLVFDVKAYVPGDYKRVNPGEEVLANIDLYNLGVTQKVNVYMIYQIRDPEGSIVVSEEETINTKADVSFTKRLTLPEDIKQGEYIFVVIAKYGDSVGTSSDVLEVVVKELFAPEDYTLLFVLIIVILIFMGIVFSILIHRGSKVRGRVPISHYKEEKRRKELIKKKRKLVKSVKDEIKKMKKDKIDVSEEEWFLKKF